MSGVDSSAPRQKILFLGKRHYTNKDAWTERFGRIYRLPAQWARAGHEVRLWLIDYHGREIVEATDGDLAVSSCPPLSLGLFVRAARALRFRPAVVVASGDCYIGGLGWLLARLSGARFVFDVYDKYDEFAGYVRPLGWDLFGFLRRHADWRLYPSTPLATFYRTAQSEAHDLVVANGVDENVFRPLPMADCRARLGLPQDAKIIGYFGSMEADRGVNDLIAAVARLREAGEPIRLLVCGRQDPATPLTREWIDYRGLVAHADMPAYLNACDVLALPYRSSPFMDMGASCKIAEYLMCRRPIVSTRTPNFVGNFPRQADELGEGVSTAGDSDDLARAISHQLQHRLVPSVPEDMTWTTIAQQALAFLSTPPAPDARARSS
ncbi:glycosyltransferase [Arenimonas oryziterrae]|uniref:Glycosyltransferase subfamily 4-like N-terminal domain-containing protein n=1 Tax=Arenimonas oryziterrae DSM 21050 = YC6267 TaxID=1121015 RepID=A0A091BFH0_9GAMM|nr:glycosyltransferase [Arenimonas oryziterrae]KFN43135.1 hypothetical protein N789_11270 [Arenimonas oryziterrae DSM 21050 = YC6267]